MKISTWTRIAGSALVASMLSLGAADAVAASAAGFTTFGTGEDAHCANTANNCNIYDGKQYVWMNGGPVAATLGAGKYFFVVLAPSGQNNPNDGGANNLSDEYDVYTNRTFTISAGGAVSYSGTHDFDGQKIRLIDYADSTNDSGVYILAICSIGPTGAGYPAKSNDCKYDAFKIVAGTPVCDPNTQDCSCLPDDPNCVTPPPRPALGVSKTADGASDEKWTWTILKSVTGDSVIKKNGGTATFNYKVDVGNDDGVVTTQVSGTIVVNVTNGPVTGTLTDNIGLAGASCTIKDGDGNVISGPYGFDDGPTLFTYVCTSNVSPDAVAARNNASVAWFDDTAADHNEDPNKTSTGGVDFNYVITQTDECVAVTDTFNGGTPASLNASLCAPGSFTPSQTVPVPTFDCVTYPNVAQFVANDTGAWNTSSASVKVCGPEKTGGLTMGFWQNPNGQGIITGQAKTGVCASGTWLRLLAPFQDLSATATCAQVATYVNNVIKAANASGAAMNAMLKGQMLATALDVYFSDPALGGNKIAAPAPIGGDPIDLTKVCKDIAACTIYENTSSAFGGNASATVSQLLTMAAGQSNLGGTAWYGQVKAKQELAKDTFDAINNQKAFAP
jgi:hypothetical protein